MGFLNWLKKKSSSVIRSTVGRGIDAVERITHHDFKITDRIEYHPERKQVKPARVSGTELANKIKQDTTHKVIEVKTPNNKKTAYYVDVNKQATYMKKPKHSQKVGNVSWKKKTVSHIDVNASKVYGFAVKKTKTTYTPSVKINKSKVLEGSASTYHPSKPKASLYEVAEKKTQQKLSELAKLNNLVNPAVKMPDLKKVEKTANKMIKTSDKIADKSFEAQQKIEKIAKALDKNPVTKPVASYLKTYGKAVGLAGHTSAGITAVASGTVKDIATHPIKSTALFVGSAGLGYGLTSTAGTNVGLAGQIGTAGLGVLGAGATALDVSKKIKTAKKPSDLAKLGSTTSAILLGAVGYETGSKTAINKIVKLATPDVKGKTYASLSKSKYIEPLEGQRKISVYNQGKQIYSYEKSHNFGAIEYEMPRVRGTIKVYDGKDTKGFEIFSKDHGQFVRVIRKKGITSVIRYNPYLKKGTLMQFDKNGRILRRIPIDVKGSITPKMLKINAEFKPQVKELIPQGEAYYLGKQRIYSKSKINKYHVEFSNTKSRFGVNVKKDIGWNYGEVKYDPHLKVKVNAQFDNVIPLEQQTKTAFKLKIKQPKSIFDVFKQQNKVNPEQIRVNRNIFDTFRFRNVKSKQNLLQLIKPKEILKPRIKTIQIPTPKINNVMQAPVFAPQVLVPKVQGYGINLFGTMFGATLFNKIKPRTKQQTKFGLFNSQIQMQPIQTKQKFIFSLFSFPKQTLRLKQQTKQQTNVILAIAPQYNVVPQEEQKLNTVQTSQKRTAISTFAPVSQTSTASMGFAPAVSVKPVALTFSAPLFNLFGRGKRKQQNKVDLSSVKHVDELKKALKMMGLGFLINRKIKKKKVEKRLKKYKPSRSLL